MELRPYQQDMLRKFAHRPDKRLLLMWCTSAGKTLGAIAAAKQLEAKRILAVAPAVGRGTWLEQFGRWAPEYVPFSIRIGRERTSGVTKKEAAYREEAYRADVQVASYGLLKELLKEPPKRYDLIVLDEFHALREPLSQQSKLVRQLFAANPQVPALGLSASGIPTDVKQIWSPLHTFWANQWGPPQPTGGVSWKFQAMFCNKIQNEHGTSYKGAKSPEALELLARKLDPFVHRVSDREVAAYLPPLHAEALRIDKTEPVTTIARDWLEQLPETVPGTGDAQYPVQPIIICFLHETAAELAAATGGELMGRIAPEARIALLAACAARGVPVIATCESIRESLSLTAYTHALVFEWRTSPAQASQLIGRFARQDATDLLRPSFVQYVVFPGDEARADVLSERFDATNAVLQRDSKNETLQQLFRAPDLTEESIEKMMDAMLGSMRTIDVDAYEPEEETV